MSKYSDLLEKLEKAEETPFYSAVVIVDKSKSHVLLGKRRDDGIWTSPAGGANMGETPKECVIREAFEEANIRLKESDLQELPMAYAENGTPVHCYIASVEKKDDIHPRHDPDKEVPSWKWFSLDEALPEPMDDNRKHTMINAKLRLAGLLKSLYKTVVNLDNTEGMSEVNTSEFAQESKRSEESPRLKQFREAMEHAQLGDIPEEISIGSTTTLYLSKVGDGMYSGYVKRNAESYYDSGDLDDLPETVLTIEKETLPTIVQILEMKELINQIKDKESQQVAGLQDLLIEIKDGRLNISGNLHSMLKGAALPVGTMRVWHGQKYQKMASGHWVPVSDPKGGTQEEPSAAPGAPQEDAPTPKHLDAHEASESTDHLKRDPSKPTVKPEEPKGDDKPKEMEYHGGAISPTSEDLKALLETGPFSIISAGRNPKIPDDKGKTDEEIEARHTELEEELKKKGYKYIPVKGHYGGEEDSFIVPHATESAMNKLGKKFNQDSVIHSKDGKHKMTFTTGEHAGKHHKGEGHKEVPDAEDFFTEVTTSDGNTVKFSLNFDFGKHHGDESEKPKKKDRQTTLEMHTKDGKLTPEREKLHQEILDKVVGQTKPASGHRPIAVLTGGGSGSGKSSVLKEIMPPLRDSLVHIDADEMKGLLPEYQKMLAEKDDRAAEIAHPESSALVQQAIQASVDGNKSFVYDSTFSRKNDMEKLINRLKGMGYEVHIVYVDLPVEVAKERSDLRAKETGRKVPHEIIEAAHKGATETLSAVHHLADSVSIFSTAEPGVKPVFSRSGQTKVVSDEATFKDMHDRGHLIKALI